MTGFLRNSKLTYLPTGHTHYHPLDASTIDHIYTNCTKLHIHSLLNNDVSDHVPVFAIKKQKPAKKARKVITGRSYRNYNSMQLSDYMNEQDWSVLDDPTTPSAIYNQLIDRLTSYLDEHHPVKTFSVPDQKYPVFKDNVLLLIQQRRYALKKA